MTRLEFYAAIDGCTHFLGGHYPRSVAKRVQEIADSPHAEHRSDMYGEGGFVTILENELAELFGKESAVFMPSGTMAQPIALRVWADQTKNSSVAFHPKCHLQCHEHMAYQELHKLKAILLGEEDRLFTLNDLKSIDEQIATLLIELPQRDLGGAIPPWNDLQEIIQHAKSKGMKLHLDGARIWECQPYYNRTYKEIVADFDSVYASFYKILGGLPGAVLAGPKDFIAEARIWMRRHGGNLPYMFPNAIAAKIGMDRHLPRIPEYVAKAREIADILSDIEGVQVLPNPTQTNMMHLLFDAKKDALLDASGQIALKDKVLLIQWLNETPQGQRTEISIGQAALDLPADQIRTLFLDLIQLANKL